MQPDKPRKRRSKHQPQGVLVLYEDKSILVVDKAPGLLTVGTDQEKERTVYWRLTDYVRKGNPKSRERIFVVHRLDRDASGMLIFARTPDAKEYLQSNWDQFEKKYLVLVDGVLPRLEDTLSSYLVENGPHRVFSTKDSRRGRLSHTAYRVLGESEEASLLEVTLLTGRKHQIRVQLADAGHPILGDRKYGNKKGAPRLALHAYSLAFTHPHTGEAMKLETRVPPLFKPMMPK